MSTTSTRTPAPEPLARSGIEPYPVTVPEYLKMIEAGVFTPDSRIELLGGLLVEKMTKGTPHEFSTGQLGEMLRELVRPIGWHVREEKTIVLGEFWSPEPDLSIVRGPLGRYRAKSPEPTDIALIVEVSESSYQRDRGFKWSGYAAAGVPIYWIVNLPDRRVEVYTSPTGHGDSARYESQANFDETTEVPVAIEGRELGRLAVRELLV